MCLCPRFALKFISLLLMVILMICCAGDMYFSYENILKSEFVVALLLIISISVSIFLSVALLVGFYISFRDKYVGLQALVFVCIAFTLSKLSLWIVSGNMDEQLHAVEYVAHLWFKLSIFAVMLVIIFVTLHCLRLQDDFVL